MKARFSFVLIALAFAIGASSLPGCDVIGKLLMATPTPTPTPQKNAALGGGNAYRTEAAVPGQAGQE
ncbi:MAG: hypothetical protein FJZ01_15310 [Candidatus Sericytochromatia bacterium]|nr:hypothetical protein [Candidatus Tanganyikabacteria bacterium]